MLPECAAALLPIWSAAPNPDSLLFAPRPRPGQPASEAPVGVPIIHTLYEDWRKADIQRVDERGRHADFHSFRCTFCRQLEERLPIQVVKQVMRHLTLQMTADLYGDLEMEDLAEEVWALPALFGETKPMVPPPVCHSHPLT